MGGSDDDVLEKEKEELYEFKDELMDESMVEGTIEDTLKVYGMAEEGGGLIEDGDDYGQAEGFKNDDEEIEKDIVIKENDNGEGVAEKKESNIEYLKEVEEEDNLEQEEVTEETLEALRKSAPDALVNNESTSNADDKLGLLWVKWGNWVSGGGTQLGAWVALLSVVVLLASAAYRCKSRSGDGAGRRPRGGNDGYTDIRQVGDSTMV